MCHILIFILGKAKGMGRQRVTRARDRSELQVATGE